MAPARLESLKSRLPGPPAALIEEADASTASMDSYLRVVAPSLAPILADQEARARLRTLARMLPPCSLAGLELRLRKDRHDVDFFVRLPHVDPQLSLSLLGHPDWRTIQRLCATIASPSEWLHERVRHLILEFDLDQPPAAVPNPGLFLELIQGEPLGTDELLALINAVGDHRYRSTALRDNLDRCLAAMPAGAGVAHLGMMLSRPGKAVRLVLQGMEVARIPDYLGAIGWHDPTQEFARLIAELSDHADPVAMLDLDVGETVMPRIGVEFYQRRQAESQPHWRAFFARLLQLELGNEEKSAALLAWPGYTQERSGKDVWSENLHLGDVLFRGMAKSIFWRNLNHIKLSYQPGQAPEAKAYLGFGHNWFPTGPAQEAA